MFITIFCCFAALTLLLSFLLYSVLISHVAEWRVTGGDTDNDMARQMIIMGQQKTIIFQNL